jgi:hypothetical protein
VGSKPDEEKELFELRNPSGRTRPLGLLSASAHARTESETDGINRSIYSISAFSFYKL